MPEPDTPGELKARALRYLARREHSRAELARKLAARAGSPEVLQALLDELVSSKQLSDERYAEARAGALGRKFGPAKVRHELKTKGVADEIVGRISLADEWEQASAILRRRYREPASTLEERAKRARFLQGRGFSIDVISRLLRDDE